jgi:hypothetical protein
VVLRCVLDELLLRAEIDADTPRIVVYDGEESFLLESVEALYYELVIATDAERLMIEGRYRLLRTAADFHREAA